MCPWSNGLKKGQKFQSLISFSSSNLYGYIFEGKTKKNVLSFAYLEQEICPWMGKIYTTTKHNNPNVRELRTQLLPQQTQVLRWPYLSAPSPGFPLLAIRICQPCARLPGGPPCWTQGVGIEPKMGIYEPTSVLTDINASTGQDCVVLATCGEDPALRERDGGGTNTEQKDIYSLVFNKALRGSSSFAHRQVYLCWKETQI